MRTSVTSRILNALGIEINPSTEEKQDESINILEDIRTNTGGGATASFSTNQIYEDSGNTYFCKEDKDGVWYIKKIDASDVFSHATILNNPTVTSYADAFTGVTGLTYGTYNQAFD